MKPFCLTSHN